MKKKRKEDDGGGDRDEAPDSVEPPTTGAAPDMVEPPAPEVASGEVSGSGVADMRPE